MGPRRLLSAVLLAAAVTAAASTPASAQGTGMDYVASDNVEWVSTIRDVGDGVGAVIIGDTMYVTTTIGLSIFDITDPADPKRLGQFHAHVAWENEEVPSNGRILGISGSSSAACEEAATNCLVLYDVTDPANPSRISTVAGAGNHTQACALDCSWFFGSSGTTVDARDPAKAAIAGDWIDYLQKDGFEFTGCHHQREVSPGIILASCQPLLLFSIRPEEGADPTHPVLIATGSNEDGRFIHSSRWPNQGRDRWMLAGGETNFNGRCDDTVSAFMTWDSTKVLGDAGTWLKGSQFTLVDEVRPIQGTYTDGHSPVQAMGCSVHWFEEHPAFRNGGLVALAEYENGTRFVQVTDAGKIIEQGYFQPIGGATSAPHWSRDGKVAYAIDYERGIDVLRWNGDSYVGPAAGGGGGGGGSSSAPAPPLELKTTLAKARLKKVLRRGLVVRATCSRACTLRAWLSLPKRTAKRLGLEGRESIAKIEIKKAATGTALRLRISRATARKLRRLKRLSAILEVSATSADGRGASAHRTVRLR